MHDAYVRGFLKAAAVGDHINETLQGMGPQLGDLSGNTKQIATRLHQLLGLGQTAATTVGGAGLGAGLGYLSGGKNDQKAKQRAVLGALLGGGGGALASAYM